MDLSEARKLLDAAPFDIKSEGRLSNDTGTQLRLKNGAIVNVFDNGNFSVQGKNGSSGFCVGNPRNDVPLCETERSATSPSTSNYLNLRCVERRSAQ